MPDDISRAEVKRLRDLPGAARTALTLEVLADTGVLWVWGDEDETLFIEDAARATLLPIWPYAALARVEYEGELAGEHPIAIAVDRFLDEWLPQLEDDEAGIAVFPVEERGAANLGVDEFRSRLSAARAARR